MKKVLVFFLVLSIIFLFSGCNDMLKLKETNAKNYNILSTKRIEEQGIDAVELIHNKTKAKIVLFMCEDENRVFNIAFKTPVSNSKGNPHILEHSVLCGSTKYDIKDPFMELAKGSLNTFLNALTFPDKTCYPVASANLKDFHNLVDVYLDAVFYPNVIKNEKIFRQEGWHYEIENKNEDLKVNGVVYNEMKGEYSDPDTVLQQSISNTLFKGSGYQYEYGGDPNEIINLSYDEFLDFHHKFYSASNAIIYYYGKLDYNEELEYLDREYLSKQEFVECDSNIKDADLWKASEESTTYYNLDSNDMKNKSYIAYSFAIDSDIDSTKSIAIQILDYVLFSSKGAILREKLQNAGFGESVSSLIDQDLKHPIYSIVSKNIDSSKKDAFIKLINDSLNELVENGIDKDKIKAAINSIYFSFAEDDFGSDPKGLIMILTSLRSYLYGYDYDIYIKYKDAFSFFENVNLDDKDNYFIKLLKEIFIDNEHKCINILSPKNGYVLENEKKLNDILNERKSKMSDTDIDNLIKSCKELKDFQKEEDPKEKVASIPTLKVSDIERDKNVVDYKTKKIEGVDTIYSLDNDKDIAYLNLSFDITDFSDEELYLIAAMKYLITKINLKDKTYQDFNNYVDMNTGGFGLSFDIYPEKVFLTFISKASEKNIDDLFAIYNEVIDNVIFEDKNRIDILLNEYRTLTYQSMLSNGHSSAANRALSTEIRFSKINDMISNTGIGFNLFIDKFAKNYSEHSELINKMFYDLFNKITSQDMTFEYCINEKYSKELEDKILKFIKDQGKKDNKEYNTLKNEIKDIDSFMKFSDFTKKDKKEAIVTPNDINFCAIANNFNKDLYNGRLRLLNVLFNYEYLWTNIRVLGGAYGCFFTNSRYGTYAFVSYRDPNLTKTNETFIGVKDFLKNFDKSDEEFTKYIIGTMGGYDNPESPYNRFIRNVGFYYNGIDNKLYNKERHDVLDAKVSDIKALAEVFEDVENGSYCALISQKSEAEAKNTYDNVWKISN